MDAATVAVAAAAGLPAWIIAADRLIPAVRRLVRLPSDVRHADLERAERIVAEALRAEALADLADERTAILALAAIAPTLQMVPGQVEQILAEMHPNSGHSLRDRLDELALLLAQHIEEAAGDRARLARIEAKVGQP